jgi:hypothetical protein
MAVMVKKFVQIETFSIHKTLYSPPGAYKTVIPGFWQAKGLSNTTFDNNSGRDFRVSPSNPSSDADTAVNQGATFIYEYIKTLLGSPFSGQNK